MNSKSDFSKLTNSDLLNPPAKPNKIIALSLMDCKDLFIRLLFIKTNTQAKKLKSHLESNNIYTIIYEFPRKIFWLRLCIQLFIDISDILHLSYILKEYKNNLNIIHLNI